MRSRHGFTLSELLIALLILGIIATFTIPKVLSAQADSRKRAVAKEAASMISGAWEAYKAANGASVNVNGPQLTPYMNYVRYSTSASDTRDAYVGTASGNCGAANMPCLVLHNGALISYYTAAAGQFGYTAATSAVWFEVDPIAGASGANSPDGVIEFWLYYNGRIATTGTITTNTCDAGGCNTPDPSRDPAWFGWN